MSRMLFHEEWAIVATIDPIDANNADSSTDIIDMARWEEVVFIVQTGVMATSSTLDFKVTEDSDSAMGSATDLTGKSIVQLTDVDDAKQVMLHVKAEELSAGERYIRGVMANSANSMLAAVVAFGRGKHQPASDLDLSSVDEIVI